MKLLRNIVALGAALAFASGAGAQPRLPEIELPPQRIVQPAYSLLPLNEPGWLLAGRTPQVLILMKLGTHADESFVIQATPFHVPAAKDSADLVQKMQEEAAKDTNPKRFRTILREVLTYPRGNAVCARVHTQAEDNAAVKRSGREGMMILEIMALLCQHPQEKELGFSIGYSQRYYPGDQDPTFVQKAMSILDSVEFISP